MASKLVPYRLKNGVNSKVVYLLCEGDTTPFDDFIKECRDKTAIAKMAKAIESIDEIGVQLSRQFNRLKPLKGGDASDLYEITVKGCTARAYSFLIDGELAIAIAFFLPKTHQGQGKRIVNASIERLSKKRKQLDEALKRRNEYGPEL